MGLLASSRLCWRHFDEDDIIKGKFILGQFHPQQRWRLKDGAAPKHLLGNNGLQDNRRAALEDLPLNGPVKKKKLQPRCKTITSILGTPISSIVQNQLTTIHHTDRRNGSQLKTKLLCTNALSDSGSSHVMFEDDTLMGYAPVPITTVLTDPGPSQVMFEDDTLIDSVPVPVTSALPDISKHSTVSQTVVIFHFLKLDPGPF
ncbi:uncharacterized protein LOC124203465 [Daphnia pulex]|uniref:uncharacterized protein LOC124203465 n=1 Tax=Daphnia pulex TaxID=6669 RepID=UPI001EDE6358|nr:uncharacterized protein LOC124203465 [Daphnia pulex]